MQIPQHPQPACTNLLALFLPNHSSQACCTSVCMATLRIYMHGSMGENEVLLPTLSPSLALSPSLSQCSIYTKYSRQHVVRRPGCWSVSSEASFSANDRTLTLRNGVVAHPCSINCWLRNRLGWGRNRKSYVWNTRGKSFSAVSNWIDIELII